MKPIYTILLLCFCLVYTEQAVGAQAGVGDKTCRVSVKHTIAPVLSAMDDVEEVEFEDDLLEPALTSDKADYNLWILELLAPADNGLRSAYPDDTPLYLRTHTILI